MINATEISIRYFPASKSNEISTKRLTKIHRTLPRITSTISQNNVHMVRYRAKFPGHEAEETPPNWFCKPRPKREKDIKHPGFWGRMSNGYPEIDRMMKGLCRRKRARGREGGQGFNGDKSPGDGEGRASSHDRFMSVHSRLLVPWSRLMLA